MRSFEIGTVHHIHSGQVDHYVEIWHQPFWPWLIAKGYHFWEKWSDPLMKHISRWHRAWFGQGEWFIPLLNRRDLRSYDLVQKKRIRLAFICITEEQYEAIAAETRKKK